MNKAIFAGALACVLFLLAGTYFFPDNAILWLAGTTTPYTIFRIIIATALVAVLCTNPPRKLYMRIFMGMVGLAMVGVGIGIAASDSVQLLDMTLFILIGIAFGIEALEFNEEELNERVVQLRQTYAQRKANSAVSTRDQAEHTVALMLQRL